MLFYFRKGYQYDKCFTISTYGRYIVADDDPKDLYLLEKPPSAGNNERYGFGFAISTEKFKERINSFMVERHMRDYGALVAELLSKFEWEIGFPSTEGLATAIDDHGNECILFNFALDSAYNEDKHYFIPQVAFTKFRNMYKINDDPKWYKIKTFVITPSTYLVPPKMIGAKQSATQPITPSTPKDDRCQRPNPDDLKDEF